MNNILSILILFTCFNAVSQEEDSIQYDLNLIGDWELSSVVYYFSDGKIDTLDINQDSIYWNVILRVDFDSVQIMMIPTGKGKNLKGYDDKCTWRLENLNNRLWITIPCGQNLQGQPEIIFVSKEELHLLYNFDGHSSLAIFKRIDATKSYPAPDRNNS